MNAEAREKIHTTLKNHHFSAWVCSICSIFLAVPLILACLSRPELDLRYDWLEDIILFIAPIYAISFVMFFIPKAITVSKAKKIFEASVTEELSHIRFTCTKMQIIRTGTKRAQILGAFLYDEEGKEYLLLLEDTIPTHEKAKFKKSLAGTFTARKFAETNLIYEIKKSI